MTGSDASPDAGRPAPPALPLQFLPVNQPGSPPELKRQRAYQSCEPCRRRKSRCVPDEAGSRQPCRRCIADGHPEACEFSETRYTRRRLSRAAGASSPGTGRVDDAGPRIASCSPVSTSPPVEQPAWTCASNGQPAGHGSSSWFSTIHRDADEPARASMPSISLPIGPPNADASPDDASSAMGQTPPTARSRIISAQLHNTADALDLLTFTAAGEQQRNPGISGPSSASNNPTPSEVATGDALLGLREHPETDWDNFILIRRGVLTKSEAAEYLDFYFDVIWSLRPVVHPFYRDKRRYGLLLAEEPLLSMTLLTLASRYHMLSGSHGEIRTERIHWQAWKFLRRYLHSALWGSPYTRSPGAIAAMLLLIEWHSKAINNPAAFSEEEDGDMFTNFPRPRPASFGSRPGQSTSLTSQERYGMATLLESLNIVAPAYRSNKMSWMLLSTAIALAHEGCCFDYLDAQAAIGPPASEHEACKQQWNQLICVFLYLADENLAMRLGLSPLLPERSSEVVRNRYSTTFAGILPDTAIWESYYDLAAETRKATLLLESLKKGGLTLANPDILPELQHIERSFARWKRQHAACLNSSHSPLLSACVDLEFHYSVMYSFAPAYSALQHYNTNQSELEKTPSDSYQPKVAALSRLADQATHASHKILSIVVNVLAPTNLGRYLPVRLWGLIVAANLHLLKSTLASSPDPSDSHPNIQLLRASIAAIRNTSPDDTHVANRYARFLEILLDASLRSSYSSQAQSPGRDGTATEQRRVSTVPGVHQPAGGGAGGPGRTVPGGDGMGSEDPDWWARYSVMASAAGLDTMATLNLSLPSGLAPQIGRDPFSWWDGAFGITGAVGFQ
ncbi:hypothetical protein VTI74DRAFT_7845 [Chaetomium olivicolor]